MRLQPLLKLLARAAYGAEIALQYEFGDWVYMRLEYHEPGATLLVPLLVPAGDADITAAAVTQELPERGNACVAETVGIHEQVMAMEKFCLE